MELAVIDPGEADADREEPPAIDTADTPTSSPDAGRAGRGRRGRAGPDPGRDRPRRRRPRRTRPQPQIYSRAQWGADERMRDTSSLHYFEVHAGFVHHTVNANGYTARARCRASSAASTRTTRSPGLERHRLQLPRRPLRPDLGGPVRRRRPAGRRRPHAGLQRLRLRDVGDRQLRHRPAVRRDGRGVRRAVRLEAVAARRGRRPRPASRSARRLPGDQRPPRRRADGLPGPLPLRPAAGHPHQCRGRPVRRRRTGHHPARHAHVDRGAAGTPTWPVPRTPTSSCGGPRTVAA